MRVALMPSTLLSLFSELSDPRRGQGKMYPLAPMLLYTVLAMLAGAVSYRQVHAFIAVHLDRLNATFGTPLRRAPAYTTVRFILRGLDGAELERAFRQHAADLSASATGEAGAPACVAIDGKTLRGSFDAFSDRKAAHVLSAFTHDGQIILGHLAINEKSNEIPAAQDMIATLGLTGRLFTLDAMHAQKNLRRSPGHGQSSAGPAQG
jgi:DDE_Tnp_1-associated